MAGMEALFAAAAAQAASKGGGFGNFKYFSLKDGEKQLVRFVSNDVVPVLMFNIKGKDGKLAEVVDSEMDSLDNPRPNIIKQHPEIFFRTSQKGEKYPMKPTLSGLGMLVKRERYIEEVEGPNGTRRKVAKFRDLEEVVKDAGGNETKKVVVYLVKATNSTFWENLAEIYAWNDGDITVRDIQVSRKGASFDTKYLFTAVDKNELAEPGEAEAHYRELLGEDAFPDINKWIESKSSESWYKKVVHPLIPELAEEAADEILGETAEESLSESSDETVSEDKGLSGLSARMKKEREARTNS